MMEGRRRLAFQAMVHSQMAIGDEYRWVSKYAALLRVSVSDSRRSRQAWWEAVVARAEG